MAHFDELYSAISQLLVSDEENRKQEQLTEVRANRMRQRAGQSIEFCDDFVKYWNDFSEQKKKVEEALSGFQYDRFRLLKRGDLEREKFYSSIHTAENAYHLFFNPDSELTDQQIIELIQFCAEKVEEVHGSIVTYDAGEESSDDDSDNDYGDSNVSELEFRQPAQDDDDDDSD